MAWRFLSLSTTKSISNTSSSLRILPVLYHSHLRNNILLSVVSAISSPSQLSRQLDTFQEMMGAPYVSNMIKSGPSKCKASDVEGKDARKHVFQREKHKRHKDKSNPHLGINNRRDSQEGIYYPTGPQTSPGQMIRVPKSEFDEEL